MRCKFSHRRAKGRDAVAAHNDCEMQMGDLPQALNRDSAWGYK
jgi:hypothetical protein